MKINVENDEMLGRAVEKELYFELFSRLKEKDKEIEKLNNDIKELLKENENKEKVIKAQDSIIKEVREWLNKTIFYFDFEKEVTSHTFELLYTAQGQELSRILDKGE